MTPRAALILVVVMLLLVLGGLLTRATEHAATHDGSASISIAPDRIDALESSSESQTVRLDRSAGPPEVWLISDQLKGQTVLWPADARTVTSGLRLLAEAGVRPARGESNAGPLASGAVDARAPGVTAVTIAGAAETVRFWFADESLAGERAAVVTSAEPEPVAGSIGDDVAGLLEPASLLAWRDHAAMPLFDSGVLTIELETDEGSLALRRTGSRWGIVSPVIAGTDAAGVRNLLDAIAALRFERFDPAGLTTPPNAPAWRMTASSRSAGRNIRWTVAIPADSGPSGSVSKSTERDPSASVVAFASIDGLTDDGSAAAASGRIEGFTAVARAATVPRLASKVASPVPATDIAEVRLMHGDTSFVSKRAGRRWTDHDQLVVELLEFLTTSPCTSIEVLTTPGNAADIIDREPPTAIAVSLARFGGLPAGEYRLGVAPDAIVVDSGSLRRVYPIGTPSDTPAATRVRAVAESLRTLAEPPTGP